jgi:hypothetical protein
MEIVQEKTVTRKHFDIGYSLYVSGLSINHCQNIFQKRGWMSANAAEGEFVTAGYLKQAAK